MFAHSMGYWHFHFDLNVGSMVGIVLFLLGASNFMFALSRGAVDIMGTLMLAKSWAQRNYLKFIMVHAPYAIGSAMAWFCWFSSLGFTHIPGTDFPLYMMPIFIIGNASWKWFFRLYGRVGRILRWFIHEYPLTWALFSVLSLLEYGVLWRHYGWGWLVYLILVHFVSLVYFVYLLWRGGRN